MREVINFPFISDCRRGKFFLFFSKYSMIDLNQISSYEVKYEYVDRNGVDAQGCKWTTSIPEPRTYLVVDGHLRVLLTKESEMFEAVGIPWLLSKDYQYLEGHDPDGVKASG